MKQMVLIAILVTCTTWRPAHGQTGPPPGWSAGVAAIMVDNGYRDMDARVFPIPFIGYEGRRLFIRGPKVGLHLHTNQNSWFNAWLTPGFSGFEAKDSPYFDGMADRDMSWLGGIEWGRQLNRQLSVSVSVGTDVAGEASGMTGELTARYNWSRGRWFGTVSPALTFESTGFVDAYFGVRPDEARPGRPAYSGKASWHPGLFVTVSRPVGPTGMFMAMIGIRHYGAGAADSPLTDRNHSLFGLLGMSWRF